MGTPVKYDNPVEPNTIDPQTPVPTEVPGNTTITEEPGTSDPGDQREEASL